MIFKSKKDIENWLPKFKEYAAFDGEKHYLVFDDRDRGGIWTLMLYNDGQFTLHGRGDDYCDDTEKEITREELVGFIWKNRKSVHETVKT